MPSLSFTPQLRRFISTPHLATSSAATVNALLQEAFALNPKLRGYVLDDQGDVRPNVAVFVDGKRQDERKVLSLALQPQSSVWVMQALSGG